MKKKIIDLEGVYKLFFDWYCRFAMDLDPILETMAERLEYASSSRSTQNTHIY